MSREFLILRIPDKTSVSVMQAFKELQRQYSEHWNDIFKSVSTASDCQLTRGKHGSAVNRPSSSPGELLLEKQGKGTYRGETRKEKT